MTLHILEGHTRFTRVPFSLRKNVAFPFEKKIFFNCGFSKALIEHIYAAMTKNKIVKIYHILKEKNSKIFLIHRGKNISLKSGIQFFHIFSYFYSTTKHEIIQIKNHNLLCSLNPPNQTWLFWLVGPL